MRPTMITMIIPIKKKPSGGIAVVDFLVYLKMFMNTCLVNLRTNTRSDRSCYQQL